MSDEIFIHPYSDEWPRLFHELGSRLRESLGDAAVRIDHIGSTAVPGLSAKPIIDIQIAVPNLEDLNRYRSRIEAVGFRLRSDNPDLTKRYFRDITGHRRTHIHVREQGSWSQQFALLFRDYLRGNSAACREYAEFKIKLADQYRAEREKYVDAKEPMIWSIMNRASEWSQAIGWKPEASDC